MNIKNTETDGLAYLPLRGTIGPDRQTSTSPSLPVGDPAHIDPLDDSTLGVIAKTLSTGEPSHHPEHRTVQMEWARTVLYAEGRVSPYKLIVACRVLESLGREATEIQIARTIRRQQTDVMERISQIRADTHLRLPVWLWAAVALTWATLVAYAIF